MAPERVYLFGSHACGEATSNSDVDLMVVEREPFNEQCSRLQELRRIRAALSQCRVPKDILLLSSEKYTKWANSANHVVGCCHREGMLMYERP